VPVVSRFLRWSALGLRAKGLIVVGLPIVPLAVFWAIVVVGVVREGEPPTRPAAAGRAGRIWRGLQRPA
jgi:hypothetical protein